MPTSLTAFTLALEGFVDGVEEYLLQIEDHAELVGLLVNACDLITSRCGSGRDVYDAAASALDIYQQLVAELTLTNVPVAIENAIVGVEDWMQRETRLDEWKEALTDMDSRMQVEFAPGTELDADSAEGLDGAICVTKISSCER